MLSQSPSLNKGWRRRRRNSFMIFSAIILVVLLLSPSAVTVVTATITLASTGTQYHSRPAAFGFNLEYGLQYVALLQVVEDDLHLCGGINDIKDEDDTGGEFDDGVSDWVENDHGIQRSYKSFFQNSIPSPHRKWSGIIDIGGGEDDTPPNNSNSTGKADNIHVVPSHGVPIAVLAKRGQCTYETKARIASQHTSPHGAVRFVIVYDNVERDGDRLITMMPKDDTDDESGGIHKMGHELFKGVGLVFVSYESGVDLHEWIKSQEEYIKSQGGPRILIDGSDHWTFPPMDQSAAGMAFILMLFGCVCSMSLFLNTTFGTGRNSNDSVINDHHLFFLGPDGQLERNRNNRTSRRGNGLRLLTMEEVETLPTREYLCSPTSSSDSSSGDSGTRSPPSSSLELRDKVNDEQHHLSLHGNDMDEISSRRGSGGGLCEALLPTKEEKEDYFDHNTCSICLDEYEPGEHIRVLPCQHTFHSDCIFPWLTERSPTCPLCKAMFEAVQEEQQEEEESAAPSGDEEQQSVQTETSAASLHPPIEDEPPIHRRRQPRSTPNNAEETAAAATSASRDEIQSSTSSRRLSGRLWGLFGASQGATDTTNNTLEEPLISNGENVV